jgi:hypothetical protein
MRSAKPTTVPACTTDTGSGLSEVNAIREDVLLFAEDLEVFAEEELILPFCKGPLCRTRELLPLETIDLMELTGYSGT